MKRKKEKKEKEETRLVGTLKWVLGSLVFLWTLLLLRSYVFINAIVPTESMVPTIQAGDSFIGNRLEYNKNNLPDVGEVIVFNKELDGYPKDALYVKRVAATEGMALVVQENNSITFYSSKEEMESDLEKPQGKELVVPKNSVFVLGDNKDNSYDSRYWKNPFVHYKKIKGKAILRYNFTKIGFNFIDQSPLRDWHSK